MLVKGLRVWGNFPKLFLYNSYRGLLGNRVQLLKPLSGGQAAPPPENPEKASPDPRKNAFAYLLDSKGHPSARRNWFSDFAVPIRPGCLIDRGAA